MTRLAALVIVFAVAAPGAALAFCRTWTCDPGREACPPDPLSPLCPGGGDGDFPMTWNRRCVGYALNESTAGLLPGATAPERFATFERTTREAFERWQSVRCQGGAPSLTFVNLGRSTCRAVGYDRQGSNVNLIVFRTNAWPYEASSNALALTTVTASARTGEIYDADIEINAVEGQVRLTTDDLTPGHDLPTILTHEVGHFLGLAHAFERNAVMYPDYTPGTVKRALSASDQAGVCTMYPPSRDAPALCDPTPQGDYVSTCAPNDVRGGCSAAPPLRNSSALAAAWMVVVGLWLSFRRHRRRRRS